MNVEPETESFPAKIANKLFDTNTDDWKKFLETKKAEEDMWFSSLKKIAQNYLEDNNPHPDVILR